MVQTKIWQMTLFQNLILFTNDYGNLQEMLEMASLCLYAFSAREITFKLYLRKTLMSMASTYVFLQFIYRFRVVLLHFSF
jgi:hypothetical protein